MKKALTTIFLFLSMIAFGQKEANWWFFGTAGGLNFNCDSVIVWRGVKHYILEGCTSISDSSGNFLFFSDADTIWDRNLNIMPNGFGIGGRCIHESNSGAQPALIVKKPGNNTLYYIFTTDCVEDTLHNGMRYSIVDMSLNSGNGDVIIKNQFLFGPACEKLAAVRNYNGQYFWIVSHEFATNNFYSYLLTDTGLAAPVISSTGQIHYYTPVAPNPLYPIPEQIARGYLKFAPQGNKLISLEAADDFPNGKPLYVLHPEIFNFNDTSGIIQSQYVINHPDSLVYYGASFSPDGRKLYLSQAWYGNFLHQFDLLAGTQVDIVNSRTQVNFDTSGNQFQVGAMQLATNGKLYIATGGDWVDVINQPNNLGLSCGYQRKKKFLHHCPTPTYSNYGMPNFVESYFQSITPANHCYDSISANFSFIDMCFNNSTHFFDASSIFPETINFWRWNFGDTASGTANKSKLKNPNHQFTSVGTYNVQLIVMTDTTAICKSDTMIKTVTIQSCTGINEISVDDFHINVFPNPSSDNFNLEIETKKKMNIQFSVYDVTGKIVEAFEKEITKTTSIQVGEGLTSGIYILQLRSDNIVLNKKLIKY